MGASASHNPMDLHGLLQGQLYPYVSQLSPAVMCERCENGGLERIRKEAVMAYVAILFRHFFESSEYKLRENFCQDSRCTQSKFEPGTWRLRVNSSTATLTSSFWNMFRRKKSEVGGGIWHNMNVSVSSESSFRMLPERMPRPKSCFLWQLGPRLSKFVCDPVTSFMYRLLLPSHCATQLSSVLKTYHAIA
jgi:hypothetical protein